MSFAENLVFLRQHYGVTQEGLAEQLGVSRQTISKWEAGTNYPEMDKLLALCDLFNTNLDDLMRGSVIIAKQDTTERYDKHMNFYDASIAVGVMLILVAVGVFMLVEAAGLPENVQSAAMLSLIVVGVMIIIMGSLNHADFKRRNIGIEPRYSADVLERFGRRFPLLIASGVGIILLDVVFLVGFAPEDDSVLANGMSADALMGPFMFVMALAIGLIIWAGMQKSKYDLSELTFIAQHPESLGLPLTAVVKTPKQVRYDSILGVICGVIMLMAVIVFLVWGMVPLFNFLTQNNWTLSGEEFDKHALKDAIKSGQSGFGISWIAFPVGGILCGIVALIGSVIGKSQDDWIAEARKEDAWMKIAQDESPSQRTSADHSPQSTPASSIERGDKTTWR